LKPLIYTNLFFLLLQQCLQCRSKGGKWGQAPWSAGLGGAPAHFLQSFKTAF